MVVTRRENGFREEKTERGGVAVLEMDSENTATKTERPSTEGMDEVRERMRKNLAFIMNYDKPVEEIEKAVESQVKAPVAEAAEEDIRPTTTTMQFGDADVGSMFNEMQHEETDSSERTSGKTKLLFFLYAVAVTLILALIIVNTGIITVLNSKNEVMQGELDKAFSEYVEVNDELATHGDAYVINAAEDMGMVK